MLAGVGLIAVMLALVLRSERPSNSESDVGASEHPVGDRAPALEPPGKDAGDAGRGRLASEGEPSEVIQHAPAVAVVRGQVVDLGDQPQARLNIVDEARPTEVLATTSDDGSFVVPKAEGGACLLAAAPHITTVLKHCCTASSEDAQAVLVVCPAVDVRGRVVNPAGDAIPGCAIWLEYGQDMFRTLRRALDSTTFRTRWTKTDETGAFLLSGLPTGGGLRLRLTHAGYRESYVPIPANDQTSCLFTLEFDDLRARTVRGVVLLPDGLPAAGATVRAGDSSDVLTDESGAFAQQVSQREAGMVVHAWKAGYMPASTELAGVLDAPGGDRGLPVTLILGASPLKIAGTLLNSADVPQAGWEVTLLHGTEISDHRVPPEYLENRIGLEPRPVTTRVDGTFVIDGLLSKSYTLHFTEPVRKINFDSDPIDAGAQDVRIRVPVLLVRDRLDGRVLSHSGTAIAGVEVIALQSSRSSKGLSNVRVESTHADSEGRFAMTKLPRRSLLLSVSGENVVPAYEAIPPEWNGEEYVLRVGLKCRIRVNCGKPGADSLGVLDAAGEAQLIWSTSQTNGLRAPILDGASNPIMVGDNACTLVVYQGERELGRRSFRPMPTAELVVEF